MNLLNDQQADSTQPRLNTAFFRLLLLFAIFCYCAIWYIDRVSGLIVSFDAVSYPICIACFSLAFVLSYCRWIRDEWLHLFVYLVICGFLVGTSLWHHVGSTVAFADSSQWMGLNYVIAYLFLDAKKVLPITIGVYLATILGHFYVVNLSCNLADTLSIVINIAVAQLVYIVLMYIVLKLRIAGYVASQRAKDLERDVNIDPLTQIMNRRGIEKTIQTKQGQGSYAVMLLDIDHFKAVNDSYGHLAGDRVLVKLARHLSEELTDNDVFGRWGGEEFLVVVYNANRSAVMSKAERLRRSLARLECESIGEITVSIGVAYANEADSFINMFHLADKNLYQAKQAGRNQVASSNTNTSSVVILHER